MTTGDLSPPPWRGSLFHSNHAHVLNSQTLKFHPSVSPDPLNARSLWFPKSPPLKNPRSASGHTYLLFHGQLRGILFFSVVCKINWFLQTGRGKSMSTSKPVVVPDADQIPDQDSLQQVCRIMPTSHRPPDSTNVASCSAV